MNEESPVEGSVVPKNILMQTSKSEKTFEDFSLGDLFGSLTNFVTLALADSLKIEDEVAQRFMESTLRSIIENDIVFEAFTAAYQKTLEGFVKELGLPSTVVRVDQYSVRHFPFHLVLRSPARKLTDINTHTLGKITNDQKQKETSGDISTDSKGRAPGKMSR